MLFFLAFAVALVCALILTRVVQDQANRLGLLDPCNDRSLHTEPLPRLGGLAICLSTIITVVVLLWRSEAGMPSFDRAVVVLLAGALGIHILGLIDDLHPIHARYKLTVQTLFAAAVWYGGIRIPSIYLQGAVTLALPEWLNFALTVFWLVAITNAFNLIDGLDGLAAGAALFAFAAVFGVASIYGHPEIALIACIMAGATLGFLRYNFPSASIFLGDSGSYFIGFALAGLGLLSATKADGSVAVILPALALGLPILDTIIAIARRYLRGQAIFAADKGHIHHRLLTRGHSAPTVTLILYLGCAALSGTTVIVAEYGAHVAIPIAMAFVFLALIVLWLRFDEFEELGGLLRRSVRHRDVIGRNVRFREATQRIGELEDLREILELLGETFRSAGVPHAEIRLQRSFLNGVVAGELTHGRADDEMVIWLWPAGVSPTAGAWNASFPLLGAEDRRIGSLVIWENGEASRSSLSHIHVISSKLRQELQRRLFSYEWAIAAAVNAEPKAFDADGIAVDATGRHVAGHVMRIDDLPVVVTPATKREASSNKAHDIGKRSFRRDR